MDCDKDNVCRKQSCEKGRKEMSGDKHKQRLAQQRGGEEEKKGKRKTRELRGGTDKNKMTK